LLLFFINIYGDDDDDDDDDDNFTLRKSKANYLVKNLPDISD